MKTQKISTPEALPDEVWIKILENGVENSILDFVDLCSLSISSKHFNRLSTEDSLWTILLLQDFKRNSSTPSYCSSKKAFYKNTFVYYRRSLKSQLQRRIALFGRKIKRIQRELRVIDQQMQENSGELLKMVKDRYDLCRWKLVIAKRKKLHLEKEISDCNGNAVKLHADKEISGCYIYDCIEDISGTEAGQSSEEWVSQSEGGSSE